MELFKTVASFVVGAVGLSMLYWGKKSQSPKMMVWGGILIVLSYLVFS